MNLSTLYSIKNNLGIIFLVLLWVSCKRPQAVIETVSLAPGKVHQGITGKVLFKEGKFSSSGEIVDGKVYGVERQILLYELTNIRDTEIGEGDFVKYTSTELLDSIVSDKQGNFSKELPVGTYSIFIKESNRLYSKIEDKDYYMPVKILKDSSINILIEVDYKASYRTEQ